MRTIELKQEVLAIVVREEAKKARIARIVGIHRDTIYDWLKTDPSFKWKYEKRVNQYRAEKKKMDQLVAVEKGGRYLARYLQEFIGSSHRERFESANRYRKEFTQKHGRRYG